MSFGQHWPISSCAVFWALESSHNLVLQVLTIGQQKACTKQIWLAKLTEGDIMGGQMGFLILTCSTSQSWECTIVNSKPFSEQPEAQNCYLLSHRQCVALKNIWLGLSEKLVTWTTLMWVVLPPLAEMASGKGLQIPILKAKTRKRGVVSIAWVLPCFSHMRCGFFVNRWVETWQQRSTLINAFQEREKCWKGDS